MHKILIIILFVSGLVAPVAAQEPKGAAAAKLDSLRHQLAAAPADTHRLTLLLQLFRQTPPALQVSPYAYEGLRLARRLGSRPQTLAFLAALNLEFYRHQDFLGATRYAQAVLREATKPPIEPLYAAMASTSLGNIAGAQSNYPEARRYFWQGIRWAEAAPTSIRRLRTLAYGYSSLSSGYSFQLQQLPRQPDSLLRRVRYCIRQTLRLAGELRAAGDERSYRGHMANSWEALGDLADLTHHPDSALYYKRMALNGFRQLGAARMVMNSQQHLANLELRAGHAATAASLARQARQAAHAARSLLIEADASETLAQALDVLGRGHEAYGMLQHSHELRDTALGADKQEALTRLQVSFDTERKEARIRELTQLETIQQAEAKGQRQLLGTLVVGLLALALALAGSGVLYWRLLRSRAQLAALAATKDRLYALVAHDLRGPVQALDGLGSIIAYYLRRADLSALAQLPGLVSQAVSNVNQLLDNLLHWAASQTGELSYQPIDQPLTLAMQECAALWTTTALANQVELRVLPAPSGAQLWADPQMVRTVLRNLVGNALKFTPAGGTVILEAAIAVRGGHTLSVTDTGPGLSAADIATLLMSETGPTRLRRTGARGEQGTGLGLRLCQLFMRRHGGTVEMQSHLGHGTTAQVWFPAPH